MKFNGSNKLSALNIFNEKAKYTTFVSFDREVDIWLDKHLYGKINRNGYSVSLSEANLKQLPTSKETIFVIDFVADAFKDMVNWYQKMIFQKRGDPNGPLGKIEPTKGWVSVSLLYHEYITNMYNLFVLRFLDQKEVVTFDDFVDQFIIFLSRTNGNMPFLKSDYIYSNYCPNHISGLFIDIQKFPYDEDNKKQLIFEDVNFRLFQRACKKFGFKLNKDIPYQLVFDVGSSQGQRYFSNYGISSKSGSASDLFDIYFYQVNIKQDIETMKNYLIQFYNSFIRAYPEMTCGSKVYHRKAYIEKNGNSKEGIIYWFKTWVLMKFTGGKIKLSKQDLTVKMEKAVSLFLDIDQEAAICYIEKEVRKV